MRFRLAAVLALALLTPFAAPCPSLAQNDQLRPIPKEDLDVIKVLLAQEDAWNRGDIQAFAQSYKNSPDIIFVTGVVNRGYEGMVDAYRRNYPSKAAMGTLSFSELEAHHLDDKFAIVIGRYHLDRSKKDGGNAEGLFSLVLEKTDQGWKIVLDHTTG